MNRDEMVRYFEMAKEAGDAPAPEGEDWDPNGPADDGNPFGSPEELTRLACFIQAERAQGNIDPARESIFLVPDALAVAQQN